MSTSSRGSVITMHISVHNLFSNASHPQKQMQPTD